MSGEYLLAISIGPIQDFIAAARKTRDLWFGSHVLSKISAEAATAIKSSTGAKLISPSEDVVTKNIDRRVASKILAIVTGDPKTLAETAKNKAQECWEGFAQVALTSAGSHNIRSTIWEEQIKDVLEFYAAWVPFDRQSYRDAWQKVERLLAGRKALRNFIQSPTYLKVPKSSLDGARDSVLDQNQLKDPKNRARLRVKGAEQLDAVGLVKRLADTPDNQLVSTHRVAADPWIRGAVHNSDARACIDAINKNCHPDFACAVTDDVYHDFPCEGDVLYQNRIDSLLRQEEMADHRDELNAIKGLLPVLYDIKSDKGLKLGEPSPYFAVLVADGDRMRSAISHLKDLDATKHQEFSKALTDFVNAAEKVMIKHQGCLVYSGGDDVLAFLPLDTCLDAAQGLQVAFDVCMKHIEYSENSSAFKPTLSVGVAIGHCLEHLEYLLTLGRAAGNDAKKGRRPDNSDDRNGLAVHLQTRGGGDAVKIRAQWSESPVDRISEWIGLFASIGLPRGLPHDLRSMALTYKRWPPEVLSRELLQADLRRMLKRKLDGKADKTATEKIVRAVGNAGDLLQIAHEMVIAQHIAAAKRQADWGN